MENGEIACSRCGLVLQEEILDQRPEWRAFTPEETRLKTRTGSPTRLKRFDKGLSTTFQPYKDSYGRALPMREWTRA
jgi:transcription initiation factor TFIIB